MLQKELLVKFIEKGVLNKTVGSLVIEAKDNNLTANIITTGLIGKVNLNNYKIEDGEIGVYYPITLLKMLSILDNDIEIDLLTKPVNDGIDVISMNFKDKKGKQATYATQHVDMILRPDKDARSPAKEYEVKAELNIELINDLLKSSSVIETELITFSYKKGKLYALFTNKESGNKIEIEIGCETIEDIGKLSFNLEAFKNILSANSKKLKSAIMEISVRGMIHLSFEDSEISSEYFLLREND